MPVDPSIGLDVVGGGSGPAQAGYQPINPLATVQNFTEVQKNLNDLRQFQQVFSARQKAGQIIATSPDIDSATAALLVDPQVMGFNPEAAANLASTNNILTQQAGQVAGQKRDSFHQLLSGLPSVIEDPGQWGTVADTAIGLATPQARAGVAAAANALRSSLLDGLPSDPAAAQAEMRKRVSGWVIANGAGEALPQLFGANVQPGVGGATVPGRVAPVQGGLNGEPAGSVSLVPGGGQSGNPLSMQQPASGSSSFKLADGTPLKIGSSPTLGVSGLGGQNALSPAQQAAATSRMTEWNGPELHAFQNAQMTSGLLQQMGADFDSMAKAGGLQIPGAMGGLRNSFANTVNTIYQGLGEKPPFDPEAVGAAENLVKNTRTMGLTVLTTMLGNQREAAQTIHDITQAVPSIDNSYLGGKLLIDTLGAANQRAIDRRNFENAWQAKNQGNLQGADESFNQQAPMTGYTSKVLAKYGLGPNGFESLPALENARRLGYLTAKEAADIARDKGFKPPGAQ